jgi:hypothetical protein
LLAGLRLLLFLAFLLLPLMTLRALGIEAAAAAAREDTLDLILSVVLFDVDWLLTVVLAVGVVSATR